MKRISRRSFAAASVVAAATAALASTAVLADDAREASPVEDFLYKEIDGATTITGYVGQAEEIVIPRSIDGTLVSKVWDEAFRDKDGIRYVELPEGVAYIGYAAFAGCKSLEEVVLSERLEHIGAFAFAGCSSLASVVIPNGVMSVRKGTFPSSCEVVRADGSAVDVVNIDDLTGLEIVEFGSYPQTRDDPEPIQWLVLEERDDGTALLLSRRCLACRPYHGEQIDITWETCDLRAWLNGQFLETAFSDDERARIVEQYLTNPDNSEYGTYGGVDTVDMVFCLSLQEVEDVFGTEPGETEARLVAYATQRAIDEGSRANGSGASYWWLRSPGYASGPAANVRPDGYVYTGGAADYDVNAVRPALVVYL